MRTLHFAPPFALLAGLMLHVDAGTLHAQGVREGIKIRVASENSPRITGLVRELTTDSLVLFTENGVRVAIPRSTVRSMEYSHGKSASAGARKGALWGLATFGTLGVIMAFTVVDDSARPGVESISRGEFAAIALAEGAGLGALIGALVKSERWTPITLTPSVSTGQRGLRLGLQIR